MIGTLLNDRFRLEEKIGAGGMSTVYRAFDTTLERWVAIKVDAPRHLDGPATSSSGSAARRAPSRGSTTRTS